MSNQEINIAIAERQGWTDLHNKDRDWGWSGIATKETDWGVVGYRHPIPNYCDDLNAMHPILAEMSGIPALKFQRELVALMDERRHTWQAKPREVATAYLKTVGGWTGE